MTYNQYHNLISDIKNELKFYILDDILNSAEGDWDYMIETFIDEYGFDLVYKAYERGVKEGEFSEESLENLKDFDLE